MGHVLRLSAAGAKSERILVPGAVYHSRTFNQQWSADKSGARDRLTALIQDAFQMYRGDTSYYWTGLKEGTPVRILSLPGPWWHFEKNLLRRFPSQAALRFTCCETNKKVYALAAARMPGAASFRVINLDGASAVNGGKITLLQVPVQKLLQVTNKRFHIAWLDLFGPITKDFLGSLERLSHLIPAKGPVVIAFNVQVGREATAISFAMQPYKNRWDFLTDFVTSRFGEEFVRAQKEIYTDGRASRLQMAFIRRAPSDEFTAIADE